MDRNSKTLVSKLANAMKVRHTTLFGPEVGVAGSGQEGASPYPAILLPYESRVDAFREEGERRGGARLGIL